MLAGMRPSAFASRAAHGGVTSIAKTGMSVRSRQIPATANASRSAMVHWRRLRSRLLPFRVKAVRGIRHRSPLCRKFPIQKGLARLRTKGTQRNSRGIESSVDWLGAGYPICIGRMTFLADRPLRTITGAKAPGIIGPPSHGSGPASASKQDAILSDMRSSWQVKPIQPLCPTRCSCESRFQLSHAAPHDDRCRTAGRFRCVDHFRTFVPVRYKRDHSPFGDLYPNAGRLRRAGHLSADRPYHPLPLQSGYATLHVEPMRPIFQMI